MSDLQCAATLVLAVPAEDDRTLALADALRHRQVAVVYTSAAADALHAAEVAAVALGVRVRADPGLDEAGDGRTGTDLVQRVTTALGHICDEHRGETVLVLAGVDAVGRTVPRLAGNVPAGHAERHPLVAGATVELRADTDGWVVDTWMGERTGAGY